MGAHKRTLALLCAVACVCGSTAFARPATDIIRFKNGDKWSCEIKSLASGYLYVGLDYVDGTVNVDWTKIEQIESSQLFVVTDTNGNVHAGAISTASGESGQIVALTVSSRGTRATIGRSQVATIQQTGETILNDFHGDVSLGASYTKSNSQSQYNLTTSLKYVRRNWSAYSQFQSSFSGSVSHPSDLHDELSSYALRNLDKKNYILIGLSDFLKSDEQQLSLRTTLGGGAGKVFKSTDSGRIIAVAGAVWIHEHYQTADTPSFAGVEAMGGLMLEYFRFKTTRLTAVTFAYPGLSDPGRIRVDNNTTVKYQLIKNLYLSFSAYLNYDSKPPRPTNKGDYGASSGLGWSF
jgi:Protein of unknown function, DUF481